MKDFYTTTEVARLLGLHANTMKNWVREGKIPSFRTIGGHYRIKSDELVRALRDRNIPVPEELAMAKKMIFIVHPDEKVRGRMSEEICSECKVDVCQFGCGVDALLALPENRPSAMIWSAGIDGIKTSLVSEAIERNEKTRGINVLAFFMSDESIDIEKIDLEKSTQLYRYPQNLGEITEAVRQLKD